MWTTFNALIINFLPTVFSLHSVRSRLFYMPPRRSLSTVFKGGSVRTKHHRHLQKCQSRLKLVNARGKTDPFIAWVEQPSGGWSAVVSQTLRVDYKIIYLCVRERERGGGILREKERERERVDYSRCSLRLLCPPIREQRSSKVSNGAPQEVLDSRQTDTKVPRQKRRHNFYSHLFHYDLSKIVLPKDVFTAINGLNIKL